MISYSNIFADTKDVARKQRSPATSPDKLEPMAKE
jgi:hypothetical protein